MNAKIVCGVIFVIFCSIQLGYALKCYRCDSEAACKKASKYECNQFYANETTRYLDAYFLNVNTNLTSTSFQCLKQNMHFTSGAVTYKGCVYINANSCGLTLRPHYQQSSSKYSCNVCNNADGCNPADRKSISMTVVSVPVVIAFIYKYFM